MSDAPNDPSTETLLREQGAALTRRLVFLEDRLHRTRRWLTAFAAGSLLLTAALGAIVFVLLRRDAAPPASEVVRARQFVLTDASGRPRAEMTTEDSEVYLAMLDPTGEARVRLSVLADGSGGLVFADRAGRNRVVLGMLTDQEGHLAFADRAGTARAVLGLDADDGTTLLFADPAGVTRAGLGLDASGEPTLLLVEPSGTLPDSTVEDSVRTR